MTTTKMTFAEEMEVREVTGCNRSISQRRYFPCRKTAVWWNGRPVTEWGCQRRCDACMKRDVTNARARDKRRAVSHGWTNEESVLIASFTPFDYHTAAEEALDRFRLNARDNRDLFWAGVEGFFKARDYDGLKDHVNGFHRDGWA